MSYFRSGDPLDDFNRLDQEQAEHEKRLPVCDECGDRINDDHYFNIDGEILCWDCVVKRYRMNTEDYFNQ